MTAQCKRTWTGLLLVSIAAASAMAHAALLAPDGDGALWRPASGCVVRVFAPELLLLDGTGGTTRVAVTSGAATADGAMLTYATGLGAVKMSLDAGTGSVLVARLALALEKPVTNDLEVAIAFQVENQSAVRMGLPERNGVFRAWPISQQRSGAGRFELGCAARSPVPCSELGMPAAGLVFGVDDPELAVAFDPYCGGVIQANAIGGGTRVTVRTTYSGSLVPVQSETRTVALEFHRNGADGTCRAFYRTIPEIEPGAAWTHDVHLVYYDYLSENGEGWFKDLQTLAGRIPKERRGRVAVCLHGWYDYFQQYAYDHKTGHLIEEWTAFPGTRKIPMNIAEMHRRMKFARDLGFRVLLYFSDGTNSDSGAPAFHPEFVLKDKSGKTFPGWKGPDSLGQPLMMDPSVPGLRDWYRGYLRALLDEYATSVDGFVWDETFYIRTNFVSYPGGHAKYADRAMMSLVSELSQLVQTRRKLNPDLVFLASDIGQTAYALVAHGTYQDSAMEERHWGPSMFQNYRNCLWSCNWYPLRHAKQNEIAANKYGLPQGLSNGWEDDCGPSRMPAALLDDVLKRFSKNIETGRQRLRYLTP